MKTLVTIFIAVFAFSASAQPDRKSVVIGSKTSKPSALLVVNPQNSDQGVLLPQLTTAQRTSMNPSSPSEDGLMVFDISEKAYYFWSDGTWVKLHRDNSQAAKFYSIDPLQFQDLKPIGDLRHSNILIFENDNTFVTARPAGPGEEVIAPLNLPDKAALQEFTVYYMDNDDRNLRVVLMRKSFRGTNEEIIRWESSGASGAINSQSFTSFNGRETIDLENYTYRVVVIFDIDDSDSISQPSDAQQRIYGVKIKYAQ